MDNNKHVLESFNEFLEHKCMELNEREGSPLDLSGAKELVNLIMSYNAKLATDVYKDTGGIKGEYFRAATDSLNEGNYALSGIYSIVGNIVTRRIDKESFEVLKTLIPTIKDENYKDYEQGNRKSVATKNLAAISRMSEEDAKKLALAAVKKIPQGSEANYIASAIKTPVIWGGLLSTAEQDKSYEEFLLEAGKKGYDSKEGLRKVIDREFKDQRKDDKGRMQSPGVTAYLDKTESQIVKPSDPVVREFKTAIVEETEEDEVFKPNMYGANGESDYMDGTYKKMLDNLGAIFQRLLTGEVTSIKSITIHASSDRYRNTGPAEKLSWAQLSLLRSQSMASLVVGLASKSGLSKEVVSRINSMIMLDFKGENGDGTSGPNPPAPIKFGYYKSEGNKTVWKEGKDRNMMDLVTVDGEGTPSGEPKQVKATPDSDKNAYKAYRYNNVEIVYEAMERGSTVESAFTVEKVVDLSYPIKIRVPARYGKKRIRIPLPYIKLGLKNKSGGRRGSPTACPKFTGGEGMIKTKFGIGIKPVTILSWESDLTK
jgi:hypothetical protein